MLSLLVTLTLAALLAVVVAVWIAARQIDDDLRDEAARNLRGPDAPS